MKRQQNWAPKTTTRTTAKAGADDVFKLVGQLQGFEDYAESGPDEPQTQAHTPLKKIIIIFNFKSLKKLIKKRKSFTHTQTQAHTRSVSAIKLRRFALFITKKYFFIYYFNYIYKERNKRRRKLLLGTK